MSRRWWWKECAKIAEADFVWSQEKNESLLMEPPNIKASFSFSFPFERRGSKEKI
jgi:hexokinase